MHNIKDLVARPDFYRQKFRDRNIDPLCVEQLLEMEHKRKQLVAEVEDHRGQVNKISKEIGQMSKSGNTLEAEALKQRVSEHKNNIDKFNAQLEEVQTQQHWLLSTIPNIAAAETPVGKDEKDNVELKRTGTPRSISFPVQDHITLGEKLGMLDFEKAAQITGARNVVYRGALARLERALINFMLDSHNKAGLLEIIPPFMVNESSLFGSGQLPKFKEDLFKIEGRDWYLIPTSEVPLVNLKRDELFSLDELPLRYCAYSPCFRSEAGSYGRDTRGLIRLHQFNKVELVFIVEASLSEQAHIEMLQRACSILEDLRLPYRQLQLCTGDMGFASARTVDLEVWLPSAQVYREISSVSNCTDFQARRANIRYRNAEGKPEYAHTLNGSGLAVGRTVVAVMENYQNADGSIDVPEVLWPYMGNMKKIVK